MAEKSFGRARIMADGSVQYPKKGFEPPPPLEGYARDPGNDWRFVPLWPKCGYRYQITEMKPCGAIHILSRCTCAACPLYNQTVSLSQCEGCEFK